MRAYVVGLVLLAVSGGLVGSPPDEPLAKRVARLIRQLGHDKFVKREQASKELDAIGVPALDALRRAAASDDDPEIRCRAAQIVRAVTGRIRAAVTQQELKRLQGTWFRVSFETDGRRTGGADRSHTFTVKGDRWWTHVGGQLFNAGTVTRIEAKGNFNAIDFLITEGNGSGGLIVAIYAVEGASLKYLSSGEPRATDFTTKPGDGRNYAIFRRVTHGAARPPV